MVFVRKILVNYRKKRNSKLVLKALFFCIKALATVAIMAVATVLLIVLMLLNHPEFFELILKII